MKLFLLKFSIKFTVVGINCNCILIHPGIDALIADLFFGMTWPIVLDIIYNHTSEQINEVKRKNK